MTEHFHRVVRGTGPGLLLAHGGGGSVEGNSPASRSRSAPVWSGSRSSATRWGTAVAVRATTRHPDRVTGLVLTSGFARPENSRSSSRRSRAAATSSKTPTPGQLETAVDQLAAIEKFLGRLS
ncbi:hypothetical protein [Amycolatopsis sp. NBC_00438]|uniref:hypothetical protein n=1 Tax=Amycolatopsis sp. NBC_00438 TaxID=2903558 RepID=UPI002E1E267C